MTRQTRSGRSLSVRLKTHVGGNPACEQHDGGGVGRGASRVDCGFEVLGQSPVPVDTGEEALDDPTPGLDGKTDSTGVLADDLDGNGRRVGDAFCSVPAVGEDLLDERKCVTRGGQNRAAAVTVLDIGAMRLHQRGAPVRVEKCMALAALEFLPTS